MIGIGLRAALLPLALTIGMHQLLAESGRPGPFDLFGVGPIDHVGPLEYAGLSDLGAYVAVLVSFLLLARLLPVAAGGRENLTRGTAIAYGLLLGGALSNASEVLLRGAAMDWLWIRVDPARSIVTNWADFALLFGSVGLFVSLLWTLRQPSRST